MNDSFPDWLFLAPRPTADSTERESIARYWAMRLVWGPCWAPGLEVRGTQVSRRRRR
jgi:hypothetical protein